MFDILNIKCKVTNFSGNKQIKIYFSCTFGFFVVILQAKLQGVI